MRISTLGRWNNKIKNSKLKIKNSNPQSSIFNFQSLIGNSGFTLLELSLVILIIGVVLALTLPNIGTSKAKLEKEREIERLSQTIKYLYDLSQVKNKEIYLLFDLNTNKFRAISLLVEEYDKEGDLLPEKRISSSFKIEDIINSEGSKITEGIVPIVFHPSGFVEPATIHFIDEKETFYTLFINPLTGQSHVENGYLKEE